MRTSSTFGLLLRILHLVFPDKAENVEEYFEKSHKRVSWKGRRNSQAIIPMEAKGQQSLCLSREKVAQNTLRGKRILLYGLVTLILGHPRAERLTP